MTVTVWHNPNCSTSRKVLGFIRARGIEPKIVDYVNAPPSIAAIKAVLDIMEMKPRDLLRRRGTPHDELGLGDETLSDEAVHIAAGMLAVGYRGVVATMWSISDAHGPEIAEAFYQHILDESGEGVTTRRLDGSCAARALDHSIRKFRKKTENVEKALLTWVPYVHFGL